MKRSLCTGIVLLLVLQSHLLMAHDHGPGNDFSLAPGTGETQTMIKPSRGISPETGWFDGLDSEDHVEMVDNVTIENGSARPSFNEASPGEDTVGLWHFDGPDGDMVVDSGPYKNHGRLHGGNRSEGVMGNGIGFDGKFDRIDLTSKDSHNVTDAITIEAWMKVEPDSWKYRRAITIDDTRVKETLLDFPVLISLDDEGMKDADHDGPVRTGGRDIIFTDEKGNRHAHEIEHYDGSVGKLTAWVKFPVLASGVNTKIYVHYGNPAFYEQQSEQDVWDPDFSFVHHLSETRGTHFDSAANGVHGTPAGGIRQDSRGRIDGADEFDGDDDHVDLGEIHPPPEGTISMWVNVEKVTDNKDTIAGGKDEFEIKALEEGNGYRITNDLRVKGNKVAKSNSTLVFDRWYHVACTYDSSGNRKVYVNGEPDGSRTGPYDDPGRIELSIGARGGNSRFLAGIIDEVRMSRVERNASWINASYRNQADPAAFMSNGEQEHSGLYDVLDNWLFKRPVSIDPPTSIEDQQIRIELSYSEFDHARCLPDGDDIRFFDRDMISLPYRIERWDANGISLIWVRITEPGTSSIFMYYGNPAAGSTSNGSAAFERYDEFPDTFPRFFDDEYPGWRVEEGSWIIEDGHLKNYWGPDLLLENSTAPMVPGRALRARLIETEYWTHPQMITAWQDADNYYFVDLSGGNCRLTLGKKVDGNVSVLMEAERPEITINRWYVCELSWVSQTRIKVELWDMDGSSILSFSSSMSEGWSSGPFGLGGARGVSKTWFDNVAIRKAVEEEPSASIGNETVLGISKAGSYSLGRTTDYAIGTLNNRSITARMSAGWNHVAQTYDGIRQRLYVGGELKAERAFSTTISVNSHRLMMGELFNGSLDEVVIHGRALSAVEVAERSRRYRAEGTLRSEIVHLPEVMVWRELGYGCILPDDTVINISVYDGNTGDILIAHETSEHGGAVDLSCVNPLLHRSVFLAARFGSAPRAAPILHNWSVSWHSPGAPEVLKEDSKLVILEDTLYDNITDLDEHFHDPYSNLRASEYNLLNVTEEDHIGLNVSGSHIGVQWIDDNWTGIVTFTVTCTNVFNLTSPGVAFEVMVANVNDPPTVVKNSPEDGSTVAERELTLHWKGFDIDNSTDDLTYELYFGSTMPPPLAAGGLANEQWQTGELEDGITYYWNLSCSDGRSRGGAESGIWSFTVNTSVTVPETILISPRNGAVLSATTVRLRWEESGTETGTGDNSPMFHIYLGSGNLSLSRVAVVNGSEHTLEALGDRTVYYWKVVPVSGNVQGICASGIWSFTVDTESEPYEPEGRTLKIWLEPSRIAMLAGDTESVNVTLYSTEINSFLLVRLNVSGPLSGYVFITDTIVLERGWGNATLNISLPVDVEAGHYELNVTASFGDVDLMKVLSIYVGDAETGGGRKDTEGSESFGLGGHWLWIIPAIGLAFIVVFITVYIWVMKRRDMEHAEPRHVKGYDQGPAGVISPLPDRVMTAPPENWPVAGTDTGAGVRGDARARVGADVRTEMEDGVGAGVRTEMETGVGAGVRTEMEDGVGAGVRTEMEAGVGADVRTEMGAVIEANPRIYTGNAKITKAGAEPAGWESAPPMGRDESESTRKWELDLSEGDRGKITVPDKIIPDVLPDGKPVKVSAEGVLKDIESELARRYPENHIMGESELDLDGFIEEM